MELNYQEVTTPVRPAATVVLLREGEAGMEVFMILRHGLSDVLGGAYVFPGGKLDQADAELPAHFIDLDHDELHRRLGEPGAAPHEAAALHVAAAREAFEECGVLFARHAGGEPAGTADARRAHELLREGLGFGDMLAALDLRLSLDALRPWTRWITPRVPSMMNKRYDTRFFVAAMPRDQLAVHDDHEATDSAWLTPLAALDAYYAGRIELAPPQIMSLAHLATHDSARAVLGEAASRPPVLIQPEPFEHEGTRVLTFPGDPRHSVREARMPGPSRLIRAGRHFRPMPGFGELPGQRGA